MKQINQARFCKCGCHSPRFLAGQDLEGLLGWARSPGGLRCGSRNGAGAGAGGPHRDSWLSRDRETRVRQSKDCGAQGTGTVP